MNKLQRYHYIELANTYLEDAIPNNKVYCRPKDVSALEAENERLREALYKIQNEKCMARAIEIIEEAILS